MEKIDKIEYTVKRSRRRTIGLEVKADGSVLVRAPLQCPAGEIERIVRLKADWIRRSQAKLREKREKETADAAPDRLTTEEIQALADKAMRVIPERVQHYAPLVGVTYGRITIRNQRTRWGSCSSKGNLNFNCLLMLTPPEVIDSVVVHELCHRKEMNHSKRFYAEVLRVFPDYYKWDRWLKEHGPGIMRRMTG